MEIYCWKLISKSESLMDLTVADGMKFENHIILCTTGFDIIHFIATTRMRHLKPTEIRPILILSLEPPTNVEFQELSQFPEIYYMSGNIYDIKFIKKANILTAHKIVLLGLSNQRGNDSFDGEVADSPTILTSNTLRAYLNKHQLPCPIIVDLGLNY